MKISRAALVTLFSLAIVPSAGAGLLPGGGPAASDCYVELDVHGVAGTSNKVTCQDGDPCDVDGLCDGTCTFSVQSCLNQAGIAGCTNTGAVTLKKPKLKGARAVLASDIVKSATAPVCSAFGTIAVKTKAKGRKPGKATVTVTALSTSKPHRDADTLTLVCTPRTGACPPPTTTSTTVVAATSTSVTTSTSTTSTTIECPGLGVRIMTPSTGVAPDGSHVYTSANPTPIDVAFIGSLQLCAGSPGADGVAPLTVGADSYAAINVLNLGVLCVKVDAAGSDGKLYCDGGTPVDVDYSLDTNVDGMGGNGSPVIATKGNPGPAGSAYMTATVRTVLCPKAALLPLPKGCIEHLSDPAQCTDPTKVDFSQVDPSTLPLTTGAVLAHIVPPGGMMNGTGHPFECGSWTTVDGPGTLAIPFLVGDGVFLGLPVKDVANVVVLDD
jgi:hypothetical protein